MKKLRNSLVSLCSAAFCFALALAGCTNKQSASSGGDTPTEELVHTVTFNSQGGSDVASQQVKHGEKVAKPSDPTREGFTFKQWCEDASGATPFDFDTLIKADWTLYASWSTGGGGEVIPPEPPTTGDYYAVIGSTEIAMTSNSERIAETQTGNYVCTFTSIATGESIAFLDADRQAIANFGPDSDYDDKHNNVNVSFDGEYTIHNEATNVKVTFRTWNDGGYSFWVEGYQAGGAVTGNVIYTVNSLPDWITNDGCIIFAWTWSGTDSGSWHETTYTGETELQFGVDEEKDGFLLARCVGTTITPNWDATDSNPGRVFNKSGDITCASGTYVYASPSWEEYTPSGGSSGGDPSGDPTGPHGPEGSSHVSWYIVGQGSFVADSWTIEGGIQLYSNPNSASDLGCILSITFEVGDLFKVTDGTTWYGYEKVDTWADPSNKGLSCFTEANDGFGGTNFKCTTAGTYDIYVNSSATFWIQSAA